MKTKAAPVKVHYVNIALFAITALVIFVPFLLGLNFRVHRSLGLLGIAIINFVSSASLIPTPGFIAVGLGGHLYNPFVVALIASIASTAGQMVGFVFGYTSKKLTESEKHFLNFLTHLFSHKYAPVVIFLLAFFPNPFFDVVGIVAGLSLYPPRKFIFLVFLGRLMRDVIIAIIGHNFL
ncbi:MAG TPA: VTT domain-containing protein [Patescibacteria group bacterium]|nr:VTT domain-containing protein [Patescibacteria group bacterium]